MNLYLGCAGSRLPARELDGCRKEDSKADARIAKNLKQIYPHKRMRTPTPPPEPASELSVPVGVSSSVEAFQMHQETAIVVDQQITVRFVHDSDCVPRLHGEIGRGAGREPSRATCIARAGLARCSGFTDAGGRACSHCFER